MANDILPLLIRTRTYRIALEAPGRIRCACCKGKAQTSSIAYRYYTYITIDCQY